MYVKTVKKLLVSASIRYHCLDVLPLFSLKKLLVIDSIEIYKSVFTFPYLVQWNPIRPIYILQVAETVRSLGKPLIQTVSLTVNPMNGSHMAHVGLFQGPPDTEVIYKGKTVDSLKKRL